MMPNRAIVLAAGLGTRMRPYNGHIPKPLVEIGGKNTMPEFTEHLTGASVGDERTFDVKYPDDSQDQRLAGKTLRCPECGAAVPVPSVNMDAESE